MTALICVGVPYPLGEYDPHSPVFMVEKSGFAESIGAKWVTVHANLNGSDDPFVAVNTALAGVLQAHPDALPIIFGEDCVMSLGAVKGLNKPDLGIVWFDAHGDFNTPRTSPSGFIGGMPLAMLVGRGEQKIMQGLNLAPLKEENIILTDARNLDPLEAAALAESQITHLKHVSGLTSATLPNLPLYVHLDTDVIDSAEMPAHAYAEPNGASITEMIEVLRYVGASGQVAGLLITSWDPNRTDDQEGHLNIILKLARHFVGSLG